MAINSAPLADLDPEIASCIEGELNLSIVEGYDTDAICCNSTLVKAV